MDSPRRQHCADAARLAVMPLERAGRRRSVLAGFLRKLARTALSIPPGTQLSCFTHQSSAGDMTNFDPDLNTQRRTLVRTAILGLPVAALSASWPNMLRAA